MSGTTGKGRRIRGQQNPQPWEPNKIPKSLTLEMLREASATAAFITAASGLRSREWAERMNLCYKPPEERGAIFRQGIEQGHTAQRELNLRRSQSIGLLAGTRGRRTRRKKPAA